MKFKGPTESECAKKRQHVYSRDKRLIRGFEQRPLKVASGRCTSSSQTSTRTSRPVSASRIAFSTPT